MSILKLQRMDKWFSQVSHEKLTHERATCRAHEWKIKSHARLEVFPNVSWVRPTCEGLAKLSVWQKVKFFFTKYLPTLYIPSLPTNCNECFQRENLIKYTWKLEIVIPTIIYTFPYSFPQLLPLHLYILERLLAQTLTTPILSAKWDFGAAGRHWNEPFIGGYNRAELRDQES